MAKAVQLPSGSWRVRIYDNELKKQISFTSKLEGKAGKAEAELMAREYQLGRRQKKAKGKTFGECVDEYISLKENVLSPTTIDGYKRIKKNSLPDICNMYISDITSKDIQKLINKLSINHKPRTVHNAYNLIAAVSKSYIFDLQLQVTLPKIQDEPKQLPDALDVLHAIVGSSVELPCLLAMWCSLRLSEIKGIKHEDIKDGVLTIHQTVVRLHGQDVEKNTTKTKGSVRRIKLPDYILQLIRNTSKDSKYLVPDKGHDIYNEFVALLDKHNVPHMSFHELRHLNASIMLLLNIPDKYAMERGGWSSTRIMKSVYQHTFSAERKAVDEKIDNFFNGLLDTILDTNQE